MLACSTPRTTRLLQLSASVKSLGSRIGGWRRACATVGLLVVAFSIVAMHQLSLDHELTAPTPPSRSAPLARDAGHQHSGAHGHGTEGYLTGLASISVDGVEFSAQHGLTAVDPPNGSAGGHEQVCPGCGSNTMAFGACLLALTLLVLFWWLTPPQVRLLAPRRPVWPVTVIALAGRRVPALSLAELSILRT